MVETTGYDFEARIEEAMRFLAYVWNSGSWSSKCPGSSVNTLKSPAVKTSRLHLGAGASTERHLKSCRCRHAPGNAPRVLLPSETLDQRREVSPDCAHLNSWPTKSAKENGGRLTTASITRRSSHPNTVLHVTKKQRPCAQVAQSPAM